MIVDIKWNPESRKYDVFVGGVYIGNATDEQAAHEVAAWWLKYQKE